MIASIVEKTRGENMPISMVLLTFLISPEAAAEWLKPLYTSKATGSFFALRHGIIGRNVHRLPKD